MRTLRRKLIFGIPKNARAWNLIKKYCKQLSGVYVTEKNAREVLADLRRLFRENCLGKVTFVNRDPDIDEGGIWRDIYNIGQIHAGGTGNFNRYILVALCRNIKTGAFKIYYW